MIATVCRGPKPARARAAMLSLAAILLAPGPTPGAQPTASVSMDAAQEQAQEQDLPAASAPVMQFDVRQGHVPLTPRTAAIVRAAPRSAGAVARKLDLAAAERALVERNPSLAAARHQVDANDAAVVMASKRPNPQLTLGAEQMDAGKYISPPSSNTYTLRIDQLYERGGKRRFRTRQAKDQYFASLATLADTARTQTLALRQAFASGVLARENMRLAVDVLQQYLRTENLTQIKVKAGDLAPLELYRVQSGRLQYQQAVLQAESAYANAVRDVLNAMGVRQGDLVPSTARGPAIPRESLSITDQAIATAPVEELGELVGGASVELDGGFSDRAVTVSLDELRALARKNRPDLLAARFGADAAVDALRLARAQLTRDVSVGTELQRLSNVTEGNDPDRTTDDTFGIVFQVPLFINNDLKAGVKQAESSLHVAQAQVTQSELAVARDVESAFQNYKLARRVRNLYSKENLGQLEKLQSISAFNFRQGATSLFELLDAQRTYRQAYASYNQARSDYTNSLYQLEAAIGAPLP